VPGAEETARLVIGTGFLLRALPKRFGSRELFAAVLGLAAAWSRVGAAQVPSGRVEARVAAVTDTSQTYALYLPPGYSTERRWPVLFVLDPRGRALLGLALFQDAAARLGWIVMSSYNSLSDGPPEANVTAMSAMLASAQTRLAIDSSRRYLAGFSGTARAALALAVSLRGHVAGVIGVGGALAFQLGGPETSFAADSMFAYFGAAGTRDFNYEEVRAMGERFRTTRVPFRVAVFDGPHDWPPAAVCGEALEWLELRAMVGGLRAVDSGWVRARLAAELARAAELERLGRWDGAWRLDDAIARDYARWPEAGEAAARAAALRASPIMARYEAEARRLAERDARQGADLLKVLSWARSQREPPAVRTLTRKLRVAELQRTAERGDSLEAASARRLLARIFVFLSFYVPRADLAEGASARAVRMLEAAVTIAPIQGEGCALLREALVAATAEQRVRLAGQCTPPKE
jgi:predicted esterase